MLNTTEIKMNCFHNNIPKRMYLLLAITIFQLCLISLVHFVYGQLFILYSNNYHHSSDIIYCILDLFLTEMLFDI